MALSVAIEDPATPDVLALLGTHLTLMRATTPPESVHALDVEALRVPSVTFWTVREGDALVGCGAMKALDAAHGEIKSMHVREAHRGRGIAALLVETVLDAAAARNFTRLSLETGSTRHFAPARLLYARFGFVECGPFGGYIEDPHSTFMTKDLSAARGVLQPAQPLNRR